MSVWRDLSDFTQQHRLKPNVGHEPTFDALSQAHALLKSRASSGKLVAKLGSTA